MRFRLAALAAALLATTGSHGATLPQFPPGSPWTQDITMAPTLQGAANPIPVLAGLGGFGTGNRLQIDFSFKVVNAAAGVPTRTINGYSFDDYYLPDCEPLGTPIPVPANAQIEGQPGLSCPNDPDGEDCHLLIVQGNTLYEAYKVNAINATQFDAQCLAVWNLSYLYPEQGRGDHCTSADAAGFPIAPLLFNADEVFAAAQVNGDLGHAIRFILPNSRIARDTSGANPGAVGGRLYVRPATHAGGPTGPANTIAYGSRIRLRQDFPLTGYNAAAQVLLRTMKKYGLVLADGGTVPLTGEDDTYTTHTWTELGISEQTFTTTTGVTLPGIADFAVIDTGARIPETFDCVRTVVPTGILFSNGFE